MGINWGRGFFRLWLVIALLWVIPVGVLALRDIGRDLLPLPVPATIEASTRAAKEMCKGLPDEPGTFAAQICELEYELGRRDRLTAEEQAVEDEWHDANQRREWLTSNFATWMSKSLAFVFLPPLILLLPGLLIAWIGRGFIRISK